MITGRLVVRPVTVIGQVVHLESGVSNDAEDPGSYDVAVEVGTTGRRDDGTTGRRDDGTTDYITRYEITGGLHDRLCYEIG